MLGANAQVQRMVIGRVGLEWIEMYIEDPVGMPGDVKRALRLLASAQALRRERDWRPTILAPTLYGAQRRPDRPARRSNDGDP
jgi:hypothetical protein